MSQATALPISESPKAPPRAIISHPFDRENPYHTLYYRALAAHGYLTTDPPRNPSSSRLPAMENADILHLHWGLQNFCQGPSFFVSLKLTVRFALDLLRLRRRGKKIVWTCHNIFPHDPGYRILDWGARFILARAAHLVFVHSRATRARLRLTYWRLGSVTVIPMGSFAEAYGTPPPREDARRRLDIPTHARVFLFMGAMREHKGIPDLMTAFERMAGPDDRLLLAGRVRDESLAPLLDRAERDPRVRAVRGRFADEDAVVYLAAADVMVLPFRRLTTSASVLLAMACHVPVVLPRVGVFRELLGEDYPLFFKAGNLDALADVMRRATDVDLAALKAAYARAELSWSKAAQLSAAALDTLFTDKSCVAAAAPSAPSLPGG